MEVPKVRLAVWVGIGQAIVVIRYSLLKQLKAEARIRRRQGKLAGTRIRQQVAELDRKIKAQVVALEDGIEPELVSERIGELREQKEALEDALAELGVEQGEAEDEELERRLAAIPDLSTSLRSASTQTMRQVFEAFDLQIHFSSISGKAAWRSPRPCQRRSPRHWMIPRDCSTRAGGHPDEHSGGPLRFSG